MIAQLTQLVVRTAVVDCSNGSVTRKQHLPFLFFLCRRHLSRFVSKRVISAVFINCIKFEIGLKLVKIYIFLLQFLDFSVLYIFSLPVGI